jgi:effector-binding domain-containing protein
MLTEPQIVQLAEQPYLSIPATVPPGELPNVIPMLIGEVYRWIDAHGVQPAGPPFLRFNVIDMERELQIEVGWPVAGSATGDDRVRAGALPAGRYVTLRHTGPPDTLEAAHHALQEWAASRGLKFEVSGNTWSSRFESYLTNPEEEPNRERWQTDVAFQLAG